MCTDTLRRKQRERRARRFRKRKCVCPGARKAAARKNAAKWPRKAGGLAAAASHSQVLEEEAKGNQADAFPSGAMAPRNTTQYLMEVVYSDLNITAPSSSERNYLKPKHKHMYSYTSLDADEDTLDFQYRDSERVFYQNEL